MYVLLQRRAQKCMNPAHDVRGNPRHTKITILPQFRTSDQHEVTRGLRGRAQNLRFTTVLDVWSARNDERSDNHEVTRGLRPRSKKFAFHHSFGRPTTTKWREGCVRDLKNLHFTTVLGVRRPRSDERVVSRRCQPNPPGVKRRRNFLRSLDPQPFSAATFSSSSQQFSEQLFSAHPFSAALLSSHSQQPLSADLLSNSQSSSSQHSHSQQLFSAAILSSHSQQIFSADLLSSQSQQTFSAIILLWSGVGGQLFDHHLILSSYCGQLFHHVAVVRGWWSAIISSCCYGQGLVDSYLIIMLLWSRVGG